MTKYKVPVLPSNDSLAGCNITFFTRFLEQSYPFKKQDTFFHYFFPLGSHFFVILLKFAVAAIETEL